MFGFDTRLFTLKGSAAVLTYKTHAVHASLAPASLASVSFSAFGSRLRSLRY